MSILKELQGGGTITQNAHAIKPCNLHQVKERRSPAELHTSEDGQGLTGKEKWNF